MSEELIPESVSAALKTVRGLPLNHDGLRVTSDVRPVEAEHLAAPRRFLSPRVRSLVDLQLLTGMRSTNLNQIRTADVDTTGGKSGAGSWVYRPRKHKTQHHGHKLPLRLGPKARAILGPQLRPDAPEAFIFSPAAEAAD